MLDESTASLNQELTREVFDAIKENFGGRLVLVIGHQIVTGMFDTVINL
jgi:ABC-type transport system involved in cytochrome bd biosynthesis fused ATPase/permease subunit